MRSEIVLSRELLPPGSTVLCAVSGGADSVCLLHLVRSLGDVRCVCAHFDHALRGEESRADAEFVARLCREWDVELITGTGDAAAHAAATRQSLETAARELRYDFLFRAAAQCGADRIATGHNMNDNAETVLFRLARGTGLRGLAGIPRERGLLVRPLLGVTRMEILSYLDSRGIPHREDATNAGDGCSRNYIRHHVLPELERVSPGAVRSIARLTENAAEDEAFLDSLAREWLEKENRDPGRLSAAGLSALPRSVARRALCLWLGQELSRERTEAVLALCRAAPSARVDVPGGCVRRENDALLRTPPETAPAFEAREVLPGEDTELPGTGLRLECRELTNADEIQSSFNIFCFSCDNICGKLSVAPRSPGDRISLRGRDGTRSVKKMMIERRIPRAKRENVPVLRDEAGLLAVYGIGQSDRAFPAPGERYYKITFRELTEE